MKRVKYIAYAMCLLIIVGCAAPPKKDETVFFPSPPELPRLQYLTSFSGSHDIEEDSAFDDFVIGAKRHRKLDKPYGVGIYDGKIYVCDTNDTVIVFDLKAKKYETLKGVRGPGKLIQPLNISIEEDGTKYVTDPIRGQVVVFDKNDEYLTAYGSPGVWKPVDAAAFEDRVYVADIMNGAVRIFEKKSGKMVKSIGNSGEDPMALLSMPTNVAVDRDGYVYVADAGRVQVVKFDRDGHFIAVYGKLGNNLGHFSRPRGVALDRESRLYAVDAGFQNVQIFSKHGRILLFFGQGGRNPGDFLLPAKVTIDYDNLEYFQKYAKPDFELEYLVLVTSQFGERLVNVLGFGKEKGKTYPSEDVLLNELEEKRQREWDEMQKKSGTKEEPGAPGETGDAAGNTGKPEEK
ncbi:MAG: DUF4934 domain-containing protein [Nitrospirae bacterium]|nr:DUF4934 domain-containing protein [Nitrospirota bacterium]